MDKSLVASEQQWEVTYISYKFQIPIKDVKAARKIAGRSRKKVYQELRKMGYVITINPKR